MKKGTLALAGLGLVGVLFFALVSTGQASNIRVVQLTDGTVKYGYTWSPDGTRILLGGSGRVDIIQADGANLQTVYKGKYTNCKWLETDEILIGKTSRSRWLKPQRKLVKQVGPNNRVRILVRYEPDLLAQVSGPTLSVPLTLPDGSIGVYVLQGAKEVFKPLHEGKDGRHVLEGGKKVFKILRRGKLPPEKAVKQLRLVSHNTMTYTAEGPEYPDKDIWFESYDGTIRKRVTYDKAFHFPELSPDRSMIMAGGEGGIVILDTLGTIISVLPHGEDRRWSPNGKRITCIRMFEEPEGVIAGSEVYVVNIDGSNWTNVTQTPDEIEVNPIWSPDSRKLLFRGMDSHKIYVAFLGE